MIVGSSVSGLVGPLFRNGFILGYSLFQFILIIICLGLDFAIVFIVGFYSGTAVFLLFVLFLSS